MLGRIIDGHLARSQASSGNCLDCGVGLPPKAINGPGKLRCTQCVTSLRRKGDLARYHRKAGNQNVVPAGTEVPCVGCAKTIRKTRSDNAFCGRCLQDKANECSRRKREAERRAAGIRIRSGLTVVCNHCSASFASKAHNQIFCGGCRNQKSIRCNRVRRKTDPIFALNGMVSGAIRKSLSGSKSGRAWENLVGYSLADLVRHLERQFVDGMTWQNRGKLWVIDHIQPIASFAITGPDCPEFRACWGLPNLRPLPAALNLQKSDQRLFLL